VYDDDDAAAEVDNAPNVADNTLTSEMEDGEYVVLELNPGSQLADDGWSADNSADAIKARMVAGTGTVLPELLASELQAGVKAKATRMQMALRPSSATESRRMLVSRCQCGGSIQEGAGARH
jgi:hypothetical protein